jgi:hypothetical protein
MNVLDTKDTPSLTAPKISAARSSDTAGSTAGTTAEALLAGPVPTALVAVAVNVYAVPLLSPVTTRGLLDPVAVAPPGEAVTVYPVMAAPPVLDGAVKLTDTWPSPRTPLTLVGAPGTVAGVTAEDAALAGPVPTALVAVAVNVYAVPLLSPVTTSGLLDPVAAAPPGDAVTVYPVMAAPPVLDGAVKLTDTWLSPRTPLTPVGAPGASAATVSVAALVVAVATLLVATARYCAPFRPGEAATVSVAVVTLLYGAASVRLVKAPPPGETCH